MYEFGRSVESVRPVLLYARNNMNSEENMREVLTAICALRESLSNFNNDVPNGISADLEQLLCKFEEA
ncbi:hypothetical protein [Bacillus sp. AFS040349]|uniref:hypothetical protein n=1 Tax=Bacillus sp. AFS040349 TaxID=2033502 RepID=UPI00350E43C6